MRFQWLIGSAAVALLMQVSPAAQAGLIGNGNNSVAALFYLGASAVSVVTSSTAPYTTPAPTEIEDYVNSMGMTTNTPPPTIPASFIEGAIDESTIGVGDTQITITNLASPPMPFCSTALPCTDVFTGFGFVFFGNVDITDVTVDPASSPAFLPIAGGLTFGATDIFVNLAGDNPATNAELILDVTTSGVTPPPSVPEPPSLGLLAIGLIGLLAIEWRAKRRSGTTVIAS
jgi:PEP-CTERM motif